MDQRKGLLARLDGALEGVDELVMMDEARYLETHVIYESRSDQRARIIEWFADEISPDTPGERPFRVLSVGCGSGMLDVPIATHLSTDTEHLELQYVGVNPNRVECTSFEQRFEEASIPQASLEVVVQTFEDFEGEQTYDLIHFVHSLYYMLDPAAALEKARRLLAPGGQIVVFQAPLEDLNELAVRFYDKQYKRRTLFAEDFAKLLDAWGWPYKCGRIDAAVEMTPFLEGDATTGVALRDFIVQVDGTRLPAAVQELIERYLRLIAEDREDQSFIAHPVDVFSIAG